MRGDAAAGFGYFAQFGGAFGLFLQRRQAVGLRRVARGQGLHAFADYEQGVEVDFFFVVSGDCRVELGFAFEYFFAQPLYAVFDEPFVAGGDFAPAADGFFVDVERAVVAKRRYVFRDAREPFFVVGASLPVGADDLFKIFLVFGRQPEFVVFARVDGLKLAVEDGPADVGGEDAPAYFAASVADDEFVVPYFDALFTALFEEGLCFARHQRLPLGLKKALGEQLRVFQIYLRVGLEHFFFQSVDTIQVLRMSFHACLLLNSSLHILFARLFRSACWRLIPRSRRCSPRRAR